MKKVLIVATVVRFLNFERNDIKILREMGYEVHCATNLIDENERTKDIEMIRHQIDFARSPFSRNTMVAYKQLKKLLQEENFDLIHCHTPVGGILARLVARKYRKQGDLKVIYTAHGFHFFKGAPLKNWLLYFPIEWICSWMTDVLITINREDYERAKRCLHARKAKYVPGIGVDIDKYRNTVVDKEKYLQELDLSTDSFIILSVGELNRNKNHAVVIRALGEVKDSRIHYLIAGRGELKYELEKLSDSLGIKDNVHLLGFRNDVAQLYKIADIFILPSLREGLNVSLMEAMASGLPCVASDIRGNKDLITYQKGSYLISEYDVQQYVDAIRELYMKKKSRVDFSEFNTRNIEKYSRKNVENEMKKIYMNI